MADHWDPARFRAWLRLCERITLSTASLIVVVSDSLKDELVARGISPDRILVNPNGVDPDYFLPHSGGQQIRGEFGISPDQVVIAFVGTFSKWHGITVLRDSILQLYAMPAGASLRFLLVGQGPLL